MDKAIKKMKHKSIPQIGKEWVDGYEKGRAEMKKEIMRRVNKRMNILDELIKEYNNNKEQMMVAWTFERLAELQSFKDGVEECK
jgi:hypothetical protein